MRRLGNAPRRGIGAALLALTALCPIARGDDTPATGRGAWLGVSTRAVTQAWRDGRSSSTSGVTVIEVTPGGPADQAGIVPGDVLVKIDSRTLKSQADLAAAEGAMEPGRPVEVVLARGGGRTIMTFSMEPGQVPGTGAPAGASAAVGTSAAAGASAAVGTSAAVGASAAAGTDVEAGTGVAVGASATAVAGAEPMPPLPDQSPITITEPVPVPPLATSATAAPLATVPPAETDIRANGAAGLGVRCENLSLDLATAVGSKPGQGVLVLGVTTGSPADRATIRPGDVISFAGGQPVVDVDGLDRIIATATSPLSITAVRKGTSRVVAAEFPMPPAPEVKASDAQGTDQQLASLRDEVRTLREELRKLREELAKQGKGSDVPHP